MYAQFRNTFIEVSDGNISFPLRRSVTQQGRVECVEETHENEYGRSIRKYYFKPTVTREVIPEADTETHTHTRLPTNTHSQREKSANKRKKTDTCVRLAPSTHQLCRLVF
eukprot:GDKI01044721.1.p1 GENE.GDKI01044721.1~~GDKI01044721.1.p1  ORF type:complete len:110 (-),score=26.08 GDKI01044721.1:362-691(-)